MDKMADLVERTEEVNEIISRSYDTDDFVDEAELDAELELMSDEFAMDALPSFLTPATALPGQASAAPAAATTAPAARLPLFAFVSSLSLNLLFFHLRFSSSYLTFSFFSFSCRGSFGCRACRFTEVVTFEQQFFIRTLFGLKTLFISPSRFLVFRIVFLLLVSFPELSSFIVYFTNEHFAEQGYLGGERKLQTPPPNIVWIILMGLNQVVCS